MSSKVRKKSGEMVACDELKLRRSIQKAMKDAKVKDRSKEITEEVLKHIKKHFKKTSISSKDLRDIVEDVLIKHKLHKVAKAYLLFGPVKSLPKQIFGKDGAVLDANAMAVLKQRYLKRNNKGNVVEDPESMMARVAKHVASAEKKTDRKKWENAFGTMLADLDFLPNTPCMVNAGNPLGQLFACFVLDVPDSMDKIFDTLKNSAMIFKTGGGVGYSFSDIRPKGSIISSTGREASGPITFMEVFDKATDVVKRGGVRRGAIMGVLRVDHPDILEFIEEKAKGNLTNFNVSVGVNDEFMRAVIHNTTYWLKDHNSKKIESIRAREVYDKICEKAWKCGDPGLLFLDEINRNHPMKKLGKIETTNPCGEVPLLQNEACCLGSVNLAHMVRNSGVNWVKLDKTTRMGVRFLDNMITINKYPTKTIEKMCTSNRKIGLGVMGWADMLVSLGIPYDSQKALSLAKKVMKFIQKSAEEESEKLAKEKGAFKNLKKSWFKKKRRNATLLSIAPTGTISIIAGCSSGIEPLFGVSFVRNVMDGTELFYVNPAFEQVARYQGFYSKNLMAEISKQGTVQGIRKVPKDVQKLFVTATDIEPEWHIQMQAVFQSEVDNAVSKTINLPNNATIQDLKRAYMLAWRQKCKGITVYRYGSKDSQVLYLGEGKHTEAHAEYSGGNICKNCEY